MHPIPAAPLIASAIALFRREVTLRRKDDKRKGAGCFNRLLSLPSAGDRYLQVSIWFSAAVMPASE